MTKEEKQQEIRCGKIIGEARELVGEITFDTIDALMNADDEGLRKIVALLWQQTHRHVCLANDIAGQLASIMGK